MEHSERPVREQDLRPVLQAEPLDFGECEDVRPVDPDIAERSRETLNRDPLADDNAAARRPPRNELGQREDDQPGR
jgi:hypothetical protein